VPSTRPRGNKQRTSAFALETSPSTLTQSREPKRLEIALEVAD
jgi:hypothetical protein